MGRSVAVALPEPWRETQHQMNTLDFAQPVLGHFCKDVLWGRKWSGSGATDLLVGHPAVPGERAIAVAGAFHQILGEEDHYRNAVPAAYAQVGSSRPSAQRRSRWISSPSRSPISRPATHAIRAETNGARSTMLAPRWAANASRRST